MLTEEWKMAATGFEWARPDGTLRATVDIERREDDLGYRVVVTEDADTKIDHWEEYVLNVVSILDAYGAPTNWDSNTVWEDE